MLIFKIREKIENLIKKIKKNKLIIIIKIMIEIKKELKKMHLIQKMIILVNNKTT